MHLLPKLVTAAGEFALPFADRTAWRIAAALVAGQRGHGDAHLLGEALALDAPLALWTVCRAAQRGHDELRDLEGLAAWLAGAALDELAGCARGDDRAQSSRLDAAADLAAQSLGVAGIAQRVADANRLDVSQTYLLGLLCFADAWLSRVASPVESAACASILPNWLRAALLGVDRAHGAIATPADCVAAAMRMSECRQEADERHPRIAFDCQTHQDEMAAARQAWLEPSPEQVLGDSIARLRRLRDLEENFRKTLETEKLESLKELAYGAGHEINNPLANISARAQTLLHAERDPDRRRMLAAINTQAFRAHEMIADMMLFARPPQPKLQLVDLSAQLGQLHEELAPLAARQQTELVLRVPQAPVAISADPTQIVVAARAVCLNALEAVANGGRVEIVLDEPALSPESVQITVHDDGPGIDEETRRHLFDPFYSGREAGRGLGFGLSKCWRIVTMHGGQVDVTSHAGQGTTLTISLPRGNTR